MINRRELLQCAAGWGMSPLLEAAGAYRPVLGSNTFIWGQIARLGGKRSTEEETYAGIHEAGFRNVELVVPGQATETAARTKDLLARFALRPVAAFAAGGTRAEGMGGYGPILHEAETAPKGIAKILESAAALHAAGIAILHVNVEPKPRGAAKTDSELAIEAQSLDRLGKELADRGIRLALHQHAAEMDDHAREWRYILHHTDPKRVWFNLDVEWVLRGGEDPMTLAREAGRRIASLHVRNSKDKVWSEALGDGDIDYRALAAHLKEIGFAGPVILELAYDKATLVTRSLVEDLRISRQYAEKVFGITA